MYEFYVHTCVQFCLGSFCYPIHHCVNTQVRPFRGLSTLLHLEEWRESHATTLIIPLSHQLVAGDFRHHALLPLSRNLPQSPAVSRSLPQSPGLWKKTSRQTCRTNQRTRIVWICFAQRRGGGGGGGCTSICNLFSYSTPSLPVEAKKGCIRSPSNPQFNTDQDIASDYSLSDMNFGDG